MSSIRVKSNDLDVLFNLPVTISVVEAEEEPPPAPGGGLVNLAVHLHGIWTNQFYWTNTGASGQPTDRLLSHVEALRTMGVRYVRIDFGWSSSQPTRGVFSEQVSDNARLSTLLDVLEEAGIKSYLVLSRSPAWAGSSDRAHFPKPEFVPEFGKWCGWVAKVYGSRLMGLEIWNEPNLREFSGIAGSVVGTKSEQMLTDAKARAARYVPMLKAADEGIRGVGLGVGLPVVLGGPSKCDWLFIQECAELGAFGYCDVVGIHPYQGDQTVEPFSRVANYGTYLGYERERMALGMPKVIETMRRYGFAGDMPIWCTEQGWSAHVNSSGIASYQKGVGGTTNAGALELAGRRIVESTRLLDTFPQVRMSTVYCLFKQVPGAGTSASDIHQNSFKIVDAEGEFLPQAYAVHELVEDGRLGGVRPLIS